MRFNNSRDSALFCFDCSRWKMKHGVKENRRAYCPSFVPYIAANAPFPLFPRRFSLLVHMIPQHKPQHHTPFLFLFFRLNFYFCFSTMLLSKACKEGNMGRVKKLLAKRVDPNRVALGASTPLCIAVGKVSFDD